MNVKPKLSYFVHRLLNNACFNKAYSLIGKPYIAIIASNAGSKPTPKFEFPYLKFIKLT